MTTEEMRIKKARDLRYKKGIAEGFNLSDIKEELWEIRDVTADIRWIINGDEDTLIDALDGDEEEAFEFRMMFSELDDACEQLMNIIDGEYIVECFDDFFCRVAGGCMNVLGFDSYEEDYFAMTSYESELAQEESEKRITRLTKKELLAAAEQCFGLAAAFLDIRYRYDYLKAAIDVVRNENTSFLDMIREIEKEYEKAAADYSYSIEFEKLVSALPERVWVE